jgi:hypothetical protein
MSGALETILVVDNDKTVLKSVVKLLEAAEFESAKDTGRKIP